MAALTGLLTYSGNSSEPITEGEAEQMAVDFAARAYEYADLMLITREGK